MTYIENTGIEKRNAVVSGVLFILATAAGILSVALLGSILDEPDYLVIVADTANQVTFAALLELIMAVAIGGIAVGLYPILKAQSTNMARGYLAARIFEAVPVIFAAIILLTIGVLGHENVNAGAPDGNALQLSGSVMLAVRDNANLIGTQIFFSLTALILNYSLYRSKFAPRFLSIWGLAGAALILTAGLLTMFGITSAFSTISILLYLPIALQEMVFAVWLIVIGLKPSETV
jgi:hypothetical protein